MIIVGVAYVVKFYPIFGLSLSSDPAVWGQFGDYMGGSLNPVLSFVSVVLLIKSVSLQNDANIDLRDQLRNSETTEKLRAFNSLFFNMIDSQKSLFNDFELDVEESGVRHAKRRVAAVLYIEDEIERLREKGANETDVLEFLVDVDPEDKLYAILRTFYITVKMVLEKLSDAQGFDERVRREQLLTLINFTDFSQLRLLLICIQFQNYPSSYYLKSNNEFIEALREVKLELGLY